MRRELTAILLISCISMQLHAQQKIAQAVKSAAGIHIDGTLDEPEWTTAPVSTDFITNGPVYGLPASSKTEVRVLYDNTAIYIGAYLYDDPAAVRRQFTARDNEQRSDVDYFSVFFDTYNDQQNAFQFLVTARNVQTDARVSPNTTTGYGVYGDVSWDAVWDSKVSFEKDRWVVEIRILSSLSVFHVRISRTGAFNFFASVAVTMKPLSGIPLIRMWMALFYNSEN